LKLLDRIIKEIPEEYLEQKIRNISVGIYMTVVKTRETGCAFTWSGGEEIPHLNSEITIMDDLRSLRAKDLIPYIHSKIPLERTIAMATINSLFVQLKKDVLISGNILPYLKENFKNRNISMIGYFKFHKEVSSWSENFNIIENKAVPGTTDFNQSKSILESSDLIFVTGVSILTNTLEEIIRLGKNSTIVLFGPTAPFSNSLLDSGVDFITSIMPIESDLFFNSVTEGRIVPKFRHCQLKTLTKKKIKLPEKEFFQN